ncbi:hypothetical protein R3P38DRAFT_107817 [Favolaschia claudopus]|uniref:Uncharacterized protein n=1 Tax=Favolaschia claudopus TaxID=2862362 RepID=A0AAV9ZXG3_9AGAR
MSKGRRVSAVVGTGGGDERKKEPPRTPPSVSRTSTSPYLVQSRAISPRLFRRHTRPSLLAPLPPNAHTSALSLAHACARRLSLDDTPVARSSLFFPPLPSISRLVNSLLSRTPSRRTHAPPMRLARMTQPDAVPSPTRGVVSSRLLVALGRRSSRGKEGNVGDGKIPRVRGDAGGAGGREDEVRGVSAGERDRGHRGRGERTPSPAMADNDISSRSCLSSPLSPSRKHARARVPRPPLRLSARSFYPRSSPAPASDPRHVFPRLCDARLPPFLPPLFPPLSPPAPTLTRYRRPASNAFR